jgi:hypothetical protein
MKKLVLVSVCVLSLAFAGSAATKKSMNPQTPVKTEVPATKNIQAATTKSTKMTKNTAKPATTAAKPATPAAKPVAHSK